MADSDDEIYVDVVPRLSESDADKVEHRLRDKLSHAGDSLKDSISGAFDSIGDHLGGMGGFADKIHDAISGSFSGKEWDSLGQRAGSALGRGVGDALRDVTHGDFGNVLGEFKSVGDVLGGAREPNDAPDQETTAPVRTSINAAAKASGINYRTAQRIVGTAGEHRQRQLAVVS